MLAALVIYGLFAAVVLLYFLYPMWLLFMSDGKRQANKLNAENTDVSLVLFSYNGGKFLKNKVLFLLGELSKFRNAELIIIDDCSFDDSIENIIGIACEPRLIIIRKCEHKGIPDSMNAAVNAALYQNIVFCDQRQQLEEGAITRLVSELEYGDSCAVSSCISHISKDNCFSWIRKYENIIKNLESGSGSLIGVYGPLYAFKKTAFSEVPSGIVLDDLYLSLKMLSRGKIRFIDECVVFDENVDKLFNYNRIKRYLYGFYQIVSDRLLLKELTSKHRAMLLWHKYLRLIIPVLFVASIVLTGILALQSYTFTLVFAVLALSLAYSFAPFLPQFFVTNAIRINIYYFIACLALLAGRGKTISTQ